MCCSSFLGEADWLLLYQAELYSSDQFSFWFSWRRSIRSFSTYSNRRSGSSSAGHRLEISSRLLIGETCCCSIKSLSNTVSSFSIIYCLLILLLLRLAPHAIPN